MSNQFKPNKTISLFAEEKEAISDIEEIKQADKYNTTELSINHSQITSIHGIQEFECLIALDLSSNQIKNILNSQTMNLSMLKKINLSCNYLSSLNGFENLSNVGEINVAHNKIVNIEALAILAKKNNRNLKLLLLEDNLIDDFEQLDYLLK